MFLRFSLFFLIAIVFTGCSHSRYRTLSEERFPPREDPSEVRLYVNQVRRPHIELAYVQSFADVSQDPETRREQLRELRETAASLGADAVIEVRRMKNRVRGFVRDERVPFRSYTQDRYEMYFMRGVAIRFVEEDEAARVAPVRLPVAPPPVVLSPDSEIPTVVTRDPREDVPG